jgi:hypothetical protein
VGWYCSVSIAMMAYIVVEGDLLQFPALQRGRSAMSRIIMLGLSDP